MHYKNMIYNNLKTNSFHQFTWDLLISSPQKSQWNWLDTLCTAHRVWKIEGAEWKKNILLLFVYLIFRNIYVVNLLQTCLTIAGSQAKDRAQMQVYCSAQNGCD